MDQEAVGEYSLAFEGQGPEAKIVDAHNVAVDDPDRRQEQRMAEWPNVRRMRMAVRVSNSPRVFYLLYKNICIIHLLYDSGRAQTMAIADPKAKKILIIDDDASLCEVLGLALKHAGFQVQGCTELEPAKAKVASYQPDLIILDLLIPGSGGGVEFLRFLRENSFQKIPVIVITGHYTSDSEYENMIRREPSVVDFLKKPFNPVDLANKIHAQFDETRPESRGALLAAGKKKIDRKPQGKSGRFKA